jgi:sugar lactone lactonase YvrE
MSTARASPKVERIGTGFDVLGESAHWCVREGVLYWVDIRAPALRRLDPGTGAITSYGLPDLCGGVVQSGDGGLLLALRLGVVRFDTQAQTLTPFVAPEPESSGNRLNETKVDRRGRLWTSSMRDFGLARSGSVYRIDHDAACTTVMTDITVPNALSWSPDDRTMYFADTPDGRLRAYDFDIDTGAIGEMRVLLDAGIVPGRPDGATVDADGCVWSARYDGGCVARITPQGRVDRVISVPASRVTSCGFGSAELRTLYITTARQKLTPEELRAQPLAGSLFAVRLETGGLPEPRFGERSV